MPTKVVVQVELISQVSPTLHLYRTSRCDQWEGPGRASSGRSVGRTGQKPVVSTTGSWILGTFRLKDLSENKVTRGTEARGISGLKVSPVRSDLQIRRG